jgi:hypothetical protein
MATQGIRTNRGRRHKLITGLVVGLSAATMALPAVAAGRTDAGATPAETSGTTLHRDGSKAVPFVANVSPTPPVVHSGTGFDWGDAMIGAGGAVALVALIGAGGLTIRSRRDVEPAAPAQS